MIEEMEIGILLSIAGDAPKALAGLADQMGDLDALVKTLTDSFAGLNEVMATTSGAATDAMGSLDGLIASNRLVNRTLGRTVARTEEAARGYATMADSIKGVTDAQAAMGDASGIRMLAGGAGRNVAVQDAEAGGGLLAWHKGLMAKGQGAWGAIGPLIGLDIGGHIVGNILKPGLEYSHEKAQLLLAGDTTKDYRGAVAAASTVAQTVPMETFSEALKQVNEARMIFGNTRAAIHSLPALATMNAYMTATAGHKVDYTYTAAKAMEEANVWKDPVAFQYGLNQMSKVYKATGGRVDPTDFLMVFKRAHGLEMQWSHAFDYRVLPTLMQEFKNTHGGADTVGTALFSMFQNLYGGAAAQRNMPFLMKFGLESAKDIVTTNSKMWRGFTPGTVLEAPHQQYLLQTDPAAWVSKVLVPAFQSHGVNMQNKGQVEKALSEVFQNRNTWGMVYTIIEQQEKITRDATLIGKALGDLRGLPVEMAHDAKAQWMNADIQMQNLKTTAAMAWLPIFTKEIKAVTDGLKWMGVWAIKNKSEMEDLFVAAQALAGLVAGRLVLALGSWLIQPLMNFHNYIVGAQAAEIAATTSTTALGTAETATAAETVGLGTAALRSASALMEVAAVGYAAYEATKWLLSITGMTNKMAHNKGFQSADRAVYWMTHTPAQYRALFGNQGHSGRHVFAPPPPTPQQKYDESWASLDPFASRHQAPAPAPVIHNHFYVDHHELAVHLANSQQNTGPTGPSQYAPFSTMPYPQNPAPTGG